MNDFDIAVKYIQKLRLNEPASFLDLSRLVHMRTNSHAFSDLLNELEEDKVAHVCRNSRRVWRHSYAFSDFQTFLREIRTSDFITNVTSDGVEIQIGDLKILIPNSRSVEVANLLLKNSIGNFGASLLAND